MVTHEGVRLLPSYLMYTLRSGFYPHSPIWLQKLQPSHPNSQQPDGGIGKDGCAPLKHLLVYNLENLVTCPHLATIETRKYSA